MKHLDNIFIWKESDVNLAVLYVEGLNITKAFFFIDKFLFICKCYCLFPSKFTNGK